uniref:TctD transcriptional regulator n=1 Tax=Choreocolax polysiphoniae TaxID=282351 RepID=A0A0B5VQE5_9FLOR|nr:hypothetical protein [Choreocolax polysiphoniae]AJH65832.1 hypothetical protein [Choreocolax polysiphoniae]
MKQNKKILLIDDDRNLRNLLYNYLISSGFIVYTVSNIYSALAIIKKNSLNLIISDIMMIELNGYDLISLLKLDHLFIDIPIIFLTAKSMISDRIKGYNLGCHAYLTKPFDPNELLAIINNIFYHIDISINKSLLSINKILTSSQLINSFIFTPREQNILLLVIKGYMNKEIAITLNISLRNVEKYISSLLHKTNSRNRLNLAKLFFYKI